jgi:hypothetical protein
MQTIGMRELQKNISIFTDLTKPLKIVDKRKKEDLAVVYPIKKKGSISRLSAKYKDRVKDTDYLRL